MDEFEKPAKRNPPLPVLLRTYNKMLNWRPADMANWMGKDPAEITRWLSLKKVYRPQDATLEYIARRYQDAGLKQATLEKLRHARDFGGQPDPHNPFDIPDQWMFLMNKVLSFDEDFQTKMLIKWSLDVDFSAQLLYRSQGGAPKLQKLTDLRQSGSTPSNDDLEEY